MSELFSVESILALLTLSALEIVLGIDNVVFIAIVSGKLPPEQRGRARATGLALAAFGRILLLLCVAWIITLDKHPLFTIPLDFIEHPTTAKDLILMLGGLFLVGKATWEIHHSLEGDHGEDQLKHAQQGDALAAGKKVAVNSFGSVISQILMLDLVFSIDSVLTAVGMVDPSRYNSPPFPLTDIPWPPLTIMITAVLLSIAVMIMFSGPLSRFIEQHPTMKMLALSFLLLIGFVLLAEGFHVAIPRGYVYSAMGFSLFVELLNLKLVKRRRARPTMETVARATEQENS